ncbi:hypothetical protein B296_00021275 [Ensete ventricosum]|uniref:Dirigent protein n=1 Tax=Ensete ventricosum TaxID=4639 RepID=A0A427AU77_ENSVE|nr:hypothetical protein B296_00021275 [Ensete ventricosum]
MPLEGSIVLRRRGGGTAESAGGHGGAGGEGGHKREEIGGRERMQQEQRITDSSGTQEAVPKSKKELPVVGQLHESQRHEEESLPVLVRWASSRRTPAARREAGAAAGGVEGTDKEEKEEISAEKVARLGAPKALAPGSWFSALIRGCRKKPHRSSAADEEETPPVGAQRSRRTIEKGKRKVRAGREDAAGGGGGAVGSSAALHAPPPPLFAADGRQREAVSLVFAREGGVWYGGSTLAILSSYMEASAEVEMPVVGGSGQFRMAGGDGHSLTRSYSGTTGDAT